MKQLAVKQHILSGIVPSMNLAAATLLSLVLLIGVSNSVHSQCAFGGTFYGDNITPTTVGQTVTLNNYVYGDEQYQLNATNGCNYTITTCGTTNFDTQITVFGPGNAVVAYNDDSGCPNFGSTVTFTATTTGPYIVQVNEYPCDWSLWSAEYFGVTLNSCGPATGCTNPASCNYDPSAVSDDGSCCNTQCITVAAGGGNYDNEISWELYNGVILVASGTANAPGGTVLCVADGCYTVNLIDSWGDGWNGAYMTISDSGGIILQETLAAGYGIAYEFPIGNVSQGCTNPSAPNYDPAAVCDDGSCQDPGYCYEAEPSGCPSIDLGADITMPSCFDPCAALTLTADVFETGLPTSYRACEIPYSPPYPFTAGTGFSIGVDDLWTDLITLPFNFCFFGVNYNQLVVGANGLLSFNAAYATQFCNWQFTDAVPSPNLPLNSIFGPYHDIDPSVCGDARYAIQGNYPCRVFIVNYDNVCHFSAACNNLISTHQIVLYETTNVIEVYIEDKPTCVTWNDGNAVVGIQNATGTAGVVAPGRQTGPWSSSTEAWRFTPNGAPNFEVDWYYEGLNVGTGLTIDACPGEDPQTYEAIATYTMCNGTEITVSDDVVITCASILLPVEWLEFTATLSSDSRKVNCSWILGSELDSDYFTVERSADAQVWTDIGTVDGAGTTSDQTTYSFIDFGPLGGKSYYRIRQTDFNGAFQYSEIRAVERLGGIDWVIYPNPGNGKFQVTSGIEEFSIRAIDSRGREIKVIRYDKFEFELVESAQGFYTIEFLSPEAQVLKRLPLIVE